MNNKTLIVTVSIAALLIVIVGVGVWAYDAVLGEPEAATSPITAVPLVVATSSPDMELVVTEGAAEAPTTTGEAVTETTTSEAQGSGLTLFTISQADSEASFSIYEELAGSPKTVIGTTDQVAGQVAINANDLSQSEVGVIQVNARTFVTDNDRRNNAIRNFILQTDQYEFITFTPTAITGLSGSAQAGQSYTFQVAGDLTIRAVTQPVVFEVTVQGDSASQLSGTATTTITRSDYGLTIPSVPNVANVGEEVTLQINFVAQAAS